METKQEGARCLEAHRRRVSQSESLEVRVFAGSCRAGELSGLLSPPGGFLARPQNETSHVFREK